MALSLSSIYIDKAFINKRCKLTNDRVLKNGKLGAIDKSIAFIENKCSFISLL